MKIIAIVVLLVIGIFDLMILRASANDSRKDDEQEKFIKEWNESE